MNVAEGVGQFGLNGASPDVLRNEKTTMTSRVGAEVCTRLQRKIFELHLAHKTHTQSSVVRGFFTGICLLSGMDIP